MVYQYIQYFSFSILYILSNATEIIKNKDLSNVVVAFHVTWGPIDTTENIGNILTCDKDISKKLTGNKGHFYRQKPLTRGFL